MMDLAVDHGERRPRRLDALWLAIGMSLLYALLAQRTFHANDAPGFVHMVAHGRLEHHLHFLYLPIVGAVHEVTGRLGLDVFDSLTLASALGTVLAVVLAHAAAARLGATRVDAALVAVAVGVVPGVTFFATTVEVHGVYLAFAGLAWWRFAVLRERADVVRAVIVGVASALAASVHASGQLLAPALATAFWLTGTAVPARRRLLLAGLIVAVHVGAVFATAALLRPPGGGVANQIGYLERWLRPFALADLPRSVWNEWLRPFLPLSVLCLVAFRAPTPRRWVIATAPFAALAVGVSYVLIPDPGLNREHGAYSFGFLFPLAMASVAAVPRAVVAVGLGLALGLGITDVIRHDRFEIAAADGALAVAARDGDWFLVVADDDQARALLLCAPELDVVGAFDLAAQAHAAGAGAAGLAALFDIVHDTVANGGRPLRVTGAALELWADGPDALSREFVRDHLRSRYRLDPEYVGPGRVWVATRRAAKTGEGR